MVYLFTIFVVNISFLPFYFEPCLPPIVICSMKDEIDQHYLSNIIVCKWQCYNFKITSQMIADNLHRRGCQTVGPVSYVTQPWDKYLSLCPLQFHLPGLTINQSMISGRFSYSRLLLSQQKIGGQKWGRGCRRSTGVILTQFLNWYIGRYGRRGILEVLRTYNIRQRMSLSRLGMR
jgi:hypothetical protein